MGRFLVHLVVLSVALSGNAWADCTLAPDAQAGKSAANACRACHVFEADKPSRVTGPNLHDVYGSTAGSRADFTRYSEGMLGAKAKGISWNDETLSDYLTDPKAFLDKTNGKDVPHNMAFKLADEQKRKDVVAFLKAIKGKAECN